MRSRPGRPSPRGRGELPTQRPGLAWAGLVVVGALALALWVAALGQAFGAATGFGAVTHARAQVVSCPQGVLVDPCHVRYVDATGAGVEATLARPGLIGVRRGDAVPVGIDDRGRVHVGGWRPWVDAAILLALALALTRGALGWFGRVLAHGDRPYTPGPADLAGLDSPDDLLALPRLHEWRESDRPGGQPPADDPRRSGPGRDVRRGRGRPRPPP